MSGAAPALAVLAALAGGGCMPTDEPVPPPPAALEPEIRVAIAEHSARPRISASSGLRLIDPDEGELGVVAAGTSVAASARGDLVRVEGGGASLSRRALLLAARRDGDPVLVDGRGYRGAIEVRRGADGVRVINVVALEDYLVGVVSAEMGRRGESERAALEAQAVASRTYAIRHLGRASGDGYDLVATVSHQVYHGASREEPLAREAVVATRGEILTWNGAPIDAFYSSTCGGHSESAGAVFVGGDRPYLPVRPDVMSDGTPWCAISPRYRWSEQWTPSQMAATLRRTLANEALSTAAAGDLREVRVLDRTGSGRIAALELRGADGATVVRGAAIRRVLATPEGGLLWSGDFTIRITRQGGRVERIEAEGRGAGHGVGMCQWGAIGRARAGQDYRTILASYYPGTELVTIY